MFGAKPKASFRPYQPSEPQPEGRCHPKSFSAVRINPTIAKA